MDIETAIKTAIAYETKIRDIYRQAAGEVRDPAGIRILQLLGDDEQHHVEYLQDRLEKWRQTGKLSVEKLTSAVPRRNRLAGETAKIESRMSGQDRGDEKQILSRALRAEIETSRFYRRMVAQTDAEASRMFARFLEIEDGHIDVVQAELDYLSGSGYWLGIKEFDLED